MCVNVPRHYLKDTPTTGSRFLFITAKDPGRLRAYAELDRCGEEIRRTEAADSDR
jgi:hypothetical protein